MPKVFSQMNEKEFKQFVDDIRSTDGLKKYTQSEFVISCFRFEVINLTRLKILLDALNENDNIHSLSFSIDGVWDDKKGAGRGMDAKGAKVIADFLKTNTTIRTLDLSNHSFGTEGANALAEALQINQILQEINFSNCSIDDIDQIATALKNSQSIKTIRLGDNALGDEGAKKMAEILRVNQTLTFLEFELNNISDAGARSFAEGLKLNNTLQKLTLHDYDYPPLHYLSVLGIQAFNEMLQYNLSLRVLEHSFVGPYGNIVEDFNALIRRNQLFSHLENSIKDFRKKLNTYSTPFKSKDISRQDLKGYLNLAYSHRVDKEYLSMLAYPIQFNQLSEGVRDAMLDAKEMWKETNVNENNKGRTALELYQANMEKIKALQDKQFELSAETPELKEKIIKKLRDAPEALDLAYYGRDAECLELDPLLRVAKLEAILKTTINKAHQEDAKESLLPLYYSLMGRAKDADEEKMYALSILACGAEEDGVFNKATIAAQYQIKDIEGELKKRKEELNLVDKSQEEKQPEKTTNQKIYSNPNQSSFTKFHPQAEGTGTNATPGASTSPTPAPGVSLDPAEGKKNDM